MKSDDFYPGMKVSLNGNYGVVTDELWGVGIKGPGHEASNKIVSSHYGIIRWDTNRKMDFEDWRGLWGTFIDQGGQEITSEYQFRFINDDGSLKND